MTQEEKQLLFKDLCARLPYGVKVDITYRKEHGSSDRLRICSEGRLMLNTDVLGLHIEDEIYLKPYLRPIKSMTPDECDKLFKILDIREDSGEWLKINDIGVLRLFTENGKDFYEIAEAMDYLYSIHIDFRGLLEKGLALEAPEGMYKIEEL